MVRCAVQAESPLPCLQNFLHGRAIDSVGRMGEPTDRLNRTFLQKVLIKGCPYEMAK